MPLLSGLLLNRFLLNLLIRSMEQFGRGGPNEKAISNKALLGGVFGAVVLSIYQPLVHYFGRNTLIYNSSQSPSIMGMLSIFVIITAIIFLFNKKPITRLLGSIIVFLSMSFSFSIHLGVSSTIIYIILAACSEELLKSSSLQPLYPHLLSDLILFGICAGLGFARFENIVYLTKLILNGGATEGLITGRYFSAVPLHAVWTGLVGLIYSFYYKNPRIIVGLGIIAIILFHAGYNYLLYLNTPLLTIPFILLSYCGLAWLLLKVERLYIRDGLTGLEKE